MEPDNKQIMNKLEEIKIEIDFIKDNLIENSIASEEEIDLINESIKHEKKSELISSQDLKEELGL